MILYELYELLTFTFQAPSAILSPKVESPKSLLHVANRLGYGRQGRRASRSLVDLAALAQLQQVKYLDG